MISDCPAVECESHCAVRRITGDKIFQLHARLESVAQGRPYDYYHCYGWCKRLWRIERHDRVHDETYHEPQWIGYWEDVAGTDPIVYQGPREISIRWEYRGSRTDPLRPARNKRDARRL